MSGGMNQASSVITYGAPPPISTDLHAHLTSCSNGSFPAFVVALEGRQPPRGANRQDQRNACIGWVQASGMTLGER